MAEKHDYKTMTAELAQLLEEMQSPDLDVDEAIVKYERGQKLIADIRAYLETAENKIVKRKVE